MLKGGSVCSYDSTSSLLKRKCFPLSLLPQNPSPTASRDLLRKISYFTLHR